MMKLLHSHKRMNIYVLFVLILVLLSFVHETNAAKPTTPTTAAPTNSPTSKPTTGRPTTQSPSFAPTTKLPTKAPTAPTIAVPTGVPTTLSPTISTPTRRPTTSVPTKNPTGTPTTATPTYSPIPSSQPVIPDVCVQNWSANNGRCFYKITSPQDWGNSATSCGAVLYGSTLTSLHSTAEISFINSQFGCASLSDVCWIGLYQVISSGNNQWQWKDGYTYTHSLYSFLWDSLQGNGACGALHSAGFDDMNCGSAYQAICVKEAQCRPGYYKSYGYTVTYTSIPVPDPGLCILCPAGKYRASDDPETGCIDCTPGYYGDAGATTKYCTAPCDIGYYCPGGTSRGGQIPCEAGRYGIAGGKGTAAEACAICPAGSYCPLGSKNADLKCQEGYCGFIQATTKYCSQACTPGYYCPTGSECPSVVGETRTVPAYECGLNNVYCPSGRITPLPVSEGYYAIGGTPSTRTEQVQCEQGYYCTGGVKYPCPRGKYGPAKALTQASQCLDCSAGYYCDFGSTSANDDYCAPSASPTVQYATYYCPAATTQRLQVNGTDITTPTTAPTRNREDRAPCPENAYCANGIASSKLSWDSTSPLCGSTFAFDEMVAANTRVGANPFKAVLAQAILDRGAPYTITYSIKSFDYYDAVNHPECSPGSNPTKNGNGLFNINTSTGEVTITRNDLNFEVCLPVIDLKYKMTVQARAVGESTTTDLLCDVYIKVNDVNDQPKFSAPTSYRMILEKQLRNTPVARCDTLAKSDYGCPVVENGMDPAITAIDEDDGSALTYTFQSGASGLQYFKINPCTGVISYAGNYEVSYSRFSPVPRFTFTVIATDDGNGGLFPTKSTSQIVNIYLININDPPQLPDPGSGNYFTVPENAPAGTLLTPNTLDTYDEDGDSVILSISTNDGNAFIIDPTLHTLTTSFAGSTSINFESSKKIYSIQVLGSDGVASVLKTYKIGVTNANDPPVFDTSKLVFYVVENAAAGAVICASVTGVCTATSENKVVVTDEDNIDTDTITFSLLDNQNLFNIDSNGFITTKVPLDFEIETGRQVNSGTGRRILLNVRATSSGVGITIPAEPKSVDAVVTVYIVDVNEAPIIGNNQPLGLSIIESWPIGITLPLNYTVFSSVDPDNADTILFNIQAPKQEITYSMGTYSGPSNIDGTTYFQVTTDINGNPVITTTKAIFDAVVNDALCGTGKKCKQFVLVATDNGAPVRQSSSATVTITVIETNQAPYFSTSEISVTISELQTTFYTDNENLLIGLDPDASDVLKFQIIGGTGLSLFQLDTSPTTNQFRIKKTNPSQIDFEASVNKYTLRVRAYDNGPSEYIGQICKFDATKTALLIGCGDTGGAFCYEIDERCYETCVATDTSSKSVIDSRPRINGYFCDYNGENKIGGYPDFAEVTVNIQVIDANDAPLFVDDDDNPFNDGCLMAGKVSITSSISQKVKGAVSIFDEDDVIPSVTYKGAPFTYSKGDAFDPFWTKFTLNTVTGVVSSNADTFVSLSDVGSVYSAIIQVQDSNTDGGPGSSTCNISVSIIDSNVAPTITSNVTTVSVPEGSVAGIVLPILITATDSESGVLTLFSSPSPYWTLTSAGLKTTAPASVIGYLSLGSSALDYESASSTNFQKSVLIKVSDDRSATDSVTINIVVTDVNEAPSWVVLPPTIVIPENTGIGVITGLDLRSYVADPDTQAQDSSFNTLTFSMSCNGCPFELASATTGQIRRRTDALYLDYETLPNQWQVTFTVKDGKNLSSSIQLTVKLSDVNESPYFITGISPVLTLTEVESTTSQQLYDLSQILRDDDVEDTMSTLTITLSSVGDALFTVVNGFLTLKAGIPLDYENIQQYTFDITVSDSVTTPATKSITVQVLNANDMTIASIVGGSNGVISCAGSQTLTITGTNFGFKDHASNPAHAPTLIVQYTYATLNANDVSPVFTATGCAVTAGNNVQIICQSVPGVGTGLTFTVKIGVTGTSLSTTTNIATRLSVLSYQAPQITSVTGANALMTIGGESIQVSGTCLGIAAYGIVMNHGLTTGRDSYIQYCSVSGCFVPICTSSSLNIWTCTSKPGIGKDIYWTTKIAGQQMVGNYVSGSYAAPVLTSKTFTNMPTSGVFSSPIVIQGSNFADTNEVPTVAKLVLDFIDPFTSVAGTSEFPLYGCKVTSASGLRNEITCTGSAQATGTNLSVIFEFGGLSNAKSQVLVSFAQAYISALDGEGAIGAETIGGQLITVSGSNFGPACGIPASDSATGTDDGVPCGYLSVTYSNGAKRASNPTQTLFYKPFCAIISQTSMVCKVAPGSGSGHIWTIAIGGQTASKASNLPTTSYARPTVGSYTGPGAHKAVTQGGQLIIIQGSNFGPIDGALVEAFYGDKLHEDEFKGLSCSVTVAHQEVTCTVNQGVGGDLEWIVYVDGLKSRTELMNYGKPVVTSFQNYPSGGLSPDGGELVTLIGSNFGPPIASSPNGNITYLQRVVYGPSGATSIYEAMNCTVITHRKLTCITIPGVGKLMPWSVTVEGQTSDPTIFKTSYQDIFATNISISVGNTNGGYLARIRASGLPVCDPQATIQVVFGDTVVNTASKYNAFGTLVTTCPVATSERIVDFSVPERTGAGIVDVSLRVTSSKHSQIVSSSNAAFKFTYNKPKIEQTVAEPGGSFGAVSVTLVGSNFCASESCCTTYFEGSPLTGVTSHTHDKIKFYTSRTGQVQIRCIDGQNSDVVDISTSSPFVTGTVPRLDSLEYSTQGGDRVEVWGIYFGSLAPTITIGKFTATVEKHEMVACTDPSRPATMADFSLDQGVPCFKTTIFVPQGAGKKLALVVTPNSDTMGSIADDPRFEFLSYQSPIITDVIGAGDSNKFPTLGGSSTVTIKGQNFFTSGSIVVGSSASGITCNPSTWSHSTITCTVTEGEGSALKWTVSTEGVSSAPFGSTTTSVYYLPPSSLAFEIPPLDFNTEGKETFKVTGINIGRPLKQTITIGGQSCIVTSSGHTFVNCITPSGEGKGFDVFITVGGQTVKFGSTFSYGKPVITAISPKSAPTTAIDPATNQKVVMTIYGRNFGVDVVSAYIGGTLVGERNSFKDSDLITNKFIFANHTMLQVYVPAAYGKDIPLTITVKGQTFISSSPDILFSYIEPTASTVIQVGIDGATTVSSTGTYSAPNPSAGFGTSGSGRRLDSTSYGDWESPEFSKCTGDYRAPGVFWKTYWLISPSGSYTKTVHQFLSSDCKQDSLSHIAIVTGNLIDLGVNPVISCAQTYEDKVNTVVVTPTEIGAQAMNNQCKCPGNSLTFAANVGANVEPCLKALQQNNDDSCGTLSVVYHAESYYGVYFIVDDQNLFLSKQFPTQQDVQKAQGFGIDDQPTAIAAVHPVAQGPSFPTDGCYEWEDSSEYNRRRREAFSVLGTSDIPRSCLQKAFLEIVGSNFGVNPSNAAGVLRVTFINPVTGDQFEASTTSSEGNHKQLCSEVAGCIHTHDRIKVWVPYGSGRGLRVMVQVGNQASMVNVTVNYEAPEVTAMFPGTIFRKAAFLDADGGRVVLEGKNFGWFGSKAEILINGRRCTDATWITGSDGEPYVECLATKDTVGPKSILACVANQTYVSQVFKTDAAILAAGEAAGAWLDGVDIPQADSKGYGSRVFSWAVSRCGRNKYGRLFELCSDCPVGADCGTGSFRSPRALPGFYGLEINKKDNPERAGLRCSTTTNGTDMSQFPDAVTRDTCLDFVKCEPAESCLGENKCSEGYSYAYEKCVAARLAVSNGTQFVNKQGAVLSSNSCRVQLNPYTGEYEGVHSDCRGNLTLGAACDWQRPWECSTCELVFPQTNDGNVTNSEIPAGVCTCTQPTRCSLCKINEFYRMNGSCKKCPQNVEVLIALFILGAIAACVAAYYLSKKKVNLAFVAIAVDFFQILAVFSSTRIPWPDTILRLFEIMSLFNINIDIAAPECIVPSFEYEVKFYATEFLPLAALGVLLTVHLGYTFYKIIRDGRRVKLSSHLSKLIGVFLIIMYFLYLTVTKRALDIFNCNPTTPSDGYLYTEFTSMKCDGGGLCRCDEPGGVQQSLVPASYFFLTIYSFGFPLFVFVKIHRNVRIVMEDQYLRAYGIGDTRETNPDGYDFRKRYHLLYMYYKPRTPYWLLAILFRKFMIVMSSLMFRGNPTFQMSVILLVLFWAFVMQAKFRPFLSTGERGLVIKELEARAAQAVHDPMNFEQDYEILKKVTTAVRVGNEADRRAKENKYKKKNENFWQKDVTDIQRRNRLTRERAQEYFFDFNTVELILLGCSIFICLCGIMFDSNRFQNRQDLVGQRDAIVYVLILVVCFALIYLFLIFLGEIAPWVTGYLSKFFLKHDDHKDAISNKQLDEGVIVNMNPLLNVKNISNQNAEDLVNALDHNIAALAKTEEQNKQLEADLTKMKILTRSMGAE